VPDRLFVDTVFVIALINHRDQYHQLASELADRFDSYPLLITDAVLLEIGNALARSYKKEAVEIIEQFLDSDEVETVHLTPELFERAFAMYKNYQDKEWGLVDCISFVVMRDAGVSQALTFDQHFAQAGFEALMRELPEAQDTGRIA
jgi:predicted nucleic acid-binding protein